MTNPDTHYAVAAPEERGRREALLGEPHMVQLTVFRMQYRSDLGSEHQVQGRDVRYDNLG